MYLENPVGRTLHSGATAVGDGNALDDPSFRLLDRDRTSAFIKVTLVSGSITTISVQCEQSVDGTTWESVGAAIATEDTITKITGIDRRFFRARIATLTGTSPVVDITAL